MRGWAYERARGWIIAQETMASRAEEVSSLAALLREVDKVAACRIITNAEWNKVKREALLAEVRRVVEDATPFECRCQSSIGASSPKSVGQEHWGNCPASIRESILSGLDKL